MALDTKKLELLLTQMLQVIKEDDEEPTPVPKKRGRPKGSTKKKAVRGKAAVVRLTKPVVEDVEPGTHQIKRKGTDDRRTSRPLTGQKNLFNPNDYKKCDDEGSAEWNRLKDGGIIKSKKREAYVNCVCEDCHKTISELKELARENYVCDDCMDKKIPKSR